MEEITDSIKRILARVHAQEKELRQSVEKVFILHFERVALDILDSNDCYFSLCIINCKGVTEGGELKPILILRNETTFRYIELQVASSQLSTPEHPRAPHPLSEGREKKRPKIITAVSEQFCDPGDQCGTNIEKPDADY